MHVYEWSGRMQFMAPVTEEIVLDRTAFNAKVQEMVGQANKDLEAEGLADRKTVFSAELDVLYGGQVQVKRVSSPVLTIDSDDEARRVYDAFEKEFSDAFSPARGEQAQWCLPLRDRGGAGVVLAGLGVDEPVRVVAELAEDPGGRVKQNWPRSNPPPLIWHHRVC
jgi:hypothetical protein